MCMCECVCVCVSGCTYISYSFYSYIKMCNFNSVISVTSVYFRPPSMGPVIRTPTDAHAIRDTDTPVLHAPDYTDKIRSRTVLNKHQSLSGLM